MCWNEGLSRRRLARALLREESMMSMAWSFFAFVAFSLNPGESDLLSVVDPEIALVSLGHRTDAAALRALAEGKAAAAAALSEEDAKRAERQIQNLASAVDAVREKAETFLASFGAAILPRLREVAEKDPRRAEAAKALAAKIEAAAATQASSGSIARLLAIRLLGEKKDKEALPILAACASDADPFVPIYAEIAAARIEGREPKLSIEEDPGFQKLLESVPADTHSVVVYRRVREGARIDPLAGLTEMVKASGEGSPDEVRKMMTQQLLQVANVLGNFRVDVAAFIVTGAPNLARAPRAADTAKASAKDNGTFTFILGGLGNREVMLAGIQKEGGGRDKRIDVEGFPGVTLDVDDGMVVFPSDRIAVIAIGTDRLASALPAILGNFKAGKTALPADAPMAQFIKGRAQAPGLHGFLVKAQTMLGPLLREGIRAAGGEPDALKALTALQDLDSAEVEWKPAEKGIRIDLEGTFRKPAAAKDFADFLNAKLAEGKAEVKREAATVPEGMKPMMEKWAKAIAAVEVKASGAAATIKVETDDFGMLDLPMLFFPMMMIRSF